MDLQQLPAYLRANGLERERRSKNEFPGRAAPALERLLDQYLEAGYARNPAIVEGALCLGMLGARIAARMPADLRPDPLHVFCSGAFTIVDAKLLPVSIGDLRATLHAFNDAQRAGRCGVDMSANILVVASHFIERTKCTDVRAMPRMDDIIAELRSEPARYHRTVVTALKRMLLQPQLPLAGAAKNNHHCLAMAA